MAASGGTMTNCMPSGTLSVPASVPREGVVHGIPCKTTYSGPAKASTYFMPRELDDGALEASFRGRALRGQVVDLPAGYSGAFAAHNLS